jgi:heme-degrading monooxygenase HmoA
MKRRDFMIAGGVSLMTSDVLLLSGREQPSERRGLLFAVIFEVRPTTSDYQHYLDLAKRLRPLLDQMDGFISIERFASHSRPGWILSLSYWADEAALVSWRTQPQHHEAQEQGRSGTFADYRLRVAQVIHESTASSKEWEPSRRTAYNDPARRAKPICWIASFHHTRRSLGFGFRFREHEGSR